MERVIETRLREAREALREAKRFAECTVKALGGRVSIVLFGSYARGDFNEWSDIDVLVVTEHVLPAKPHRRLELLEQCLLETPRVEPVILSLDEFKALARKRNPLVQDAALNGVILVDKLGVGKLLRQVRAQLLGEEDSAETCP